MQPPPVQATPSQNPKGNTLSGCLFLIVVIFGLFQLFGINKFLYNVLFDTPSTASKQVVRQSESQVRAELIRKQFDPWDGSHLKLKAEIKKQLDDPTGFKHIETTYTDMEDYLAVHMRFRALNSYGMSILKDVHAKTNIHTGDIIEIVAYY